MDWFLYQSLKVVLVVIVNGVLCENQVNGVLCENQVLNTRPIIGIAAMAITDKMHIEQLPHLGGKSYVASSYVKYLELAGARVVVIPPDIKIEEEKKIFDNINGLLFPGGEVNLEDSKYFHVTRRLFRLAKEANEKNNYFPVLGICRGMQAIVVHTVGSLSLLSNTNSRNYPTSLQFYEEALESKIMRDIPKKLLVKQMTGNLTAHFHRYGVTPKTFRETKIINEQFKLIATSKDRDGLEFVSIFEGTVMKSVHFFTVKEENFADYCKNPKKLLFKYFINFNKIIFVLKEELIHNDSFSGNLHPIFGLQYHPEKTMFEWAEKLNIPHEIDAIKFSQLVADNFVEETRKNKHRISKEVEEKYLITKQIPIYTGFMENSHSPFQQIYVY